MVTQTTLYQQHYNINFSGLWWVTELKFCRIEVFIFKPLCKVWGLNSQWFKFYWISAFHWGYPPAKLQTDHTPGIFDIFTGVKIALFAISFSWGKPSPFEPKYFFSSRLGPIQPPPDRVFLCKQVLQNWWIFEVWAWVAPLLSCKGLNLNISTSWMTFWMIQVDLGRFEGPLWYLRWSFSWNHLEFSLNFPKRASVAVSRIYPAYIPRGIPAIQRVWSTTQSELDDFARWRSCFEVHQARA